jgi:hypothetical protein
VKKFVNSQLTILIFGLVFWLPLAVIIFILSLLLGNAESLGDKLLLFFLPASWVHPGFGIILAVMVIYISGVILKTNRTRKLLAKIPVLGLFFGAGDIITVDRLLHMKPCIFQLAPSCLSYGWILSEVAVDLGKDNENYSVVNVYYPNVPTLVTGQVFPVRKETVIILGNPSKEVIDLLLYAFRKPKNLKFLPWEGENQEEFILRAKSFGLNISPDSIISPARRD